MRTTATDDDVRVYLDDDERAAIATPPSPMPPAVRAPNRLAFEEPLSIRLWHGLIGPIVHPRPVARARSWLWSLPIRIRGFLVAVLGPRVSEEVYEDRMAKCLDCRYARIVLSRGREHVKTYCGQCSCPAWPLSELSRKNRWRNAGCPIGLFSGPPRPEAWNEATERERAWAAKFVETANSTGSSAKSLTPTGRDVKIYPRKPCGS